MINLRHTLAEVARVIVGLVFVGSGLLKAIDPVGTALKISQYLTPILSPASAGAETITLALSFVAPSSCSGLSCLWGCIASSALVSPCSSCW